MSILFFFPVVFIWIGILHHLKNRASKRDEVSSKQFWEQERDANNVRRKDISHLPYIQIPMDTLPFQETDDPDLQRLQDTIHSLSEKEILNLSGLSNTELKMNYGPSNLERLSTSDSNFTELTRALSNWGSYLYEHNARSEARTVLEYGIQCKTEIKNNYILLAKIYVENHESQKITELLSQAESLNTLMKSSIISALQTIMD